jgi:hypothetical protein
MLGRAALFKASHPNLFSDSVPPDLLPPEIPSIIPSVTPSSNFPGILPHDYPVANDTNFQVPFPSNKKRNGYSFNNDES